MGSTLTAVTYGAAADAALAEVVHGAQAGDPLAPVTVVVPTNYVGVAARRRLAAQRGLAAVAFVTIHRLAELLGSPALARAGRRPVSTPVLAAAVRRALVHQPGVFASVREHPATEEAVARVHRELRDLTPVALARLAAQSQRAADVVRLHRAVTADLAAAWYDEVDLVVAARRAVAEQVPLVRAIGTLVVHLPQELSAGATALIADLAAVAPTHVIAGLTGAPDADAGVHASVRALGIDNDQPGPAAPTLPACLEVVTASDADEEVRAAVRTVVEAVHAHGVPLERIAMCYGSDEPYGRLLAEQLAAAGIPRNGAATAPLRERVVGRTLLALLDLHDQGLSRQAVFGLAATAPLRTPDGRHVPSAAWERRSREAGVVAGRDQWDVRLTRLAATLTDEAERVEADPDVGAGAAAGRRRRAADALALRAYVLDLADRLDPARLPTTWSGLARWASALLGDVLGPSHRRGGWPEVERRAGDAIDALLERLAGLDQVDPSTTAGVFRRTLELELDQDHERQGRLGEGVFVGSVGLALGQRPELLVVVGLAEGSFPSRPGDDALLPDHERAQAPGLGCTADRTARHHRQLLAAVAGARRAVLCVPRGDLRQSADRLPSRWLLDLLGAHTGAPVRAGAIADLDATRTVASFASGIAAVGFPATAQEQRLRTLLDHTLAGHYVDHHPAVAAHPVLRRAATLVRSRHSDEFTAFDGNLGGVGVPSPFDAAVVSPTRLEQWVACPHGYLVRHVLGVEAVENPEDRLEISPLDKGTLVHTVLDRFSAEVLARDEAGRPGPDDAWTPADQHRLLELFDAEASRYEALGLTGRDVFWRRDRRRLEGQLRRFLHDDSQRRHATRTSTIASELRFGLAGAPHGPVEVPLPDGRMVRFRGSADRVDQCEDGSLVVVDYKTGGFRDKLTADDPTAGGRRLQLPVYALAARRAAGTPDADVRAQYWLLKEKADKAIVGIAFDDDVLAHFVDVLTVIADGIAAGSFVARPVAPGWSAWVQCWYCDPDGLGTAARHRDWERKKLAPELASYLALAEGAS